MRRPEEVSRAQLGRRHSRLLLTFAFGGVALLFAETYLAAMYKARDIRSATATIVNDMLASVERVSRMGRDVDRERILVDAHILEESAPAMAEVDAQIAEARADFAENERAYGPLVTSPVENRAWQDLERDLRAVRESVDEVLALSRINRNPEARRRMATLEGRFADVDRDVARLIEINRDDADRAVGHVLALQRSASAFLGSVALVGIVLTLGLGAFATRRVHVREEQLGRYSAMLEARNRDLDAFAGRVAHDLRGPLTTISLSAATLSAEAGVAPKEEKGSSALLRRSVERMERLIDDLLSLSRIGAEGRGQVCDPSLVASQLVEELGPRLAREGGALRVTVAPCKVRCGEGLLRQALSNLADNALKYRRPEARSEAELTGRVVDGSCELRFRDNGIGMSPDEAHQAFVPFFRSARARHAPGTGLGLSIVKRVIEASGGTVSVESQLGRGTTFLIALPLAGDEPDGDRG